MPRPQLRAIQVEQRGKQANRSSQKGALCHGCRSLGYFFRTVIVRSTQECDSRDASEASMGRGCLIWQGFCGRWGRRGGLRDGKKMGTARTRKRGRDLFPKSPANGSTLRSGSAPFIVTSFSQDSPGARQGYLILRCSESSGPKARAIPAQPSPTGWVPGSHADGGPKARSIILAHESIHPSPWNGPSALRNRFESGSWAFGPG